MKKPGFTSQQTQEKNTYKKNKIKLWIKNNKVFMNYLNME